MKVGSCATNLHQPRQAWEGAAVREALRVPQERLTGVYCLCYDREEIIECRCTIRGNLLKKIRR